MTLATAAQCSEATARALTDQLRQSLSETNRLAAALPRTARAVPTSIYFIQTGTYDDDPIKIGIAESVATRLSQLQTGSPWQLRVLGTMPGGTAEERELHQRFAHLHMRGEWFEGAPELLSFIAESSR